MEKLLIILALVFTMASCGSDAKDAAKGAADTAKKEMGKAAGAATDAAKTATGAAADAAKKVMGAGEVVEIALAGDDAMKYDKSEIKVKAGQKVKLTLTHTGKMELKIMGHNFVLLKAGTDVAAFATKAIAAADNDYIPAGTDAVIVSTKTVGGGESTTVTFDAPAKGTYDFICSFPGHYAMMKGKFIVE